MPIIQIAEPYPQEGVSLPDYAQSKPVGGVPVGPVWTSSDAHELAARLGAIETHDRRGNVMWHDDFEDNLNKWVVDGVGVVTLSIEQARSGAQSGKLVTGAVADDFIQIARNIPYPRLSKFGFEISFCIIGALPLNIELRFHLIKYTGMTAYMADVRYTTDTRDLDINIGSLLTPNWENIGNFYLSYSDSLFHTLKVVGDITAGVNNYERLILDNHNFDISAHNLAGFVAPAVNPIVTVFARATTLNGVAKTAYVDDAIITQNEPANVEIT